MIGRELLDFLHTIRKTHMQHGLQIAHMYWTKLLAHMQVVPARAWDKVSTLQIVIKKSTEAAYWLMFRRV
jgi:hypothetical protein